MADARPILFSGPMVRALLAGTKTQTRRIVKREPLTWLDSGLEPSFVASPENSLSPYGQPGDLLYVREAWQLHERASDVCTVVYRASVGRSWTEAHEQFPDGLAGSIRPKPFQHGWRPGIHQPRWASRLTLEVTEVRIQRLQDISDADAMAEGILQWPDGRYAEDDYDPDPNRLAATSATAAYRLLWDHINGKDSWAANPWVWAVSFKVHQANVDQLIEGRP